MRLSWSEWGGGGGVGDIPKVDVIITCLIINFSSVIIQEPADKVISWASCGLRPNYVVTIILHVFS